MMYLVIKELSDIAEDVIMVTQSLMKDIQAKQETTYRANAIRALCQITDVGFPLDAHKKLSHSWKLITFDHTAFDDSGYWAYFESCHCRQNSICLFSSFGILLSSFCCCKRCCSTMGKRSPRIRSRQVIFWWPLIHVQLHDIVGWSTKPGSDRYFHQQYYPVPCPWFVVLDPSARSHGYHKTDTIIRR